MKEKKIKQPNENIEKTVEKQNKTIRIFFPLLTLHKWAGPSTVGTFRQRTVGRAYVSPSARG